nr:pitrilysin family protein [Pseudovibrio flavus]
MVLSTLLAFPTPLLAETPQKADSTAFADVKIGPDIATKTLDNGLQLVVIPDHRAPVVTHMAWYKVGSADEAPGKSGIAHFLEHLMFKGTSNAPEGEFSDIIAEVGGQENAFTSTDYTAYYQQVAKDHLPTMMKYEADRMGNLVLTDEQVLPEREVILEERAQRVGQNPGAKLAESFDQMMFVNHPYGTPIIGWEDEIKKLNREDAFAFYDKYYTPNNAVVVVAGDVTMDEVLPIAQETYGKLKRRAEPGERIRPQVQRIPGERVATLEDERVAQPSLQKGWLVPSTATAAKGEAEALDLLSYILGGGANSRFYQQLVVDSQKATSAGSWYNSDTLDTTQFKIYATPSEGVPLEEVEADALAIVADVAENGVSQAELERAKKSMLAAAIYAQDKQSTLARVFGTALTTGATVEEVQTWPARIAAVTNDQIKAAAQKYLTEEPLSGYLLPANYEEPEAKGDAQ